MRFITISFFFLFISTFQSVVYAQIGIGNTDPDPSSILDIRSDTQGMLTPRMTGAQRIAIVTPAKGLLVFDIDDDTFYYHDGTNWV